MFREKKLPSTFRLATDLEKLLEKHEHHHLVIAFFKIEAGNIHRGLHKASYESLFRPDIDNFDYGKLAILSLLHLFKTHLNNHPIAKLNTLLSDYMMRYGLSLKKFDPENTKATKYYNNLHQRFTNLLDKNCDRCLSGLFSTDLYYTCILYQQDKLVLHNKHHALAEFIKTEMANINFLGMEKIIKNLFIPDIFVPENYDKAPTLFAVRLLHKYLTQHQSKKFLTQLNQFIKKYCPDPNIFNQAPDPQNRFEHNLLERFRDKFPEKPQPTYGKRACNNMSLFSHEQNLIAYNLCLLGSGNANPSLIINCLAGINSDDYIQMGSSIHFYDYSFDPKKPMNKVRIYYPYNETTRFHAYLCCFEVVSGKSLQETEDILNTLSNENSDKPIHLIGIFSGETKVRRGYLKEVESMTEKFNLTKPVYLDINNPKQVKQYFQAITQKLRQTHVMPTVPLEGESPIKRRKVTR